MEVGHGAMRMDPVASRLLGAQVGLLGIAIVGRNYSSTAVSSVSTRCTSLSTTHQYVHDPSSIYQVPN